MEVGTKQPDGSEWPVVAEEERALYEILFYSQGPVDGYLLGESVRDLFLRSGLSLRILSQIWNLADVSNDNVLNVHEFVLVMHLIRGQLKGLKAPPTLPRKLTPPKTEPVPFPRATPQEKEAYTKVFHALDVHSKGFLDGECCRQVFLTSGLMPEVLSHVWNLSDVTRDGQLDLAEFCLACHLLRFIKAGNSISGPVDVFQLLPDKVAERSLQARKRRVQQYEQHKQKLMSLKEKRRQQVIQENKRLQLQQEKLDLLKQVYKIQKRARKPQVPEDTFSECVAKEKEEIEKLEEIVFRLKKEHEKVRQETVRIILAEQKLNSDIVSIKKDTDELNKRLATCHTHATKDTDPFHQLYEQRKEKRQGSTIKDLDKIVVSLPFDFNPFDPGLGAQTICQGAQLFAAAPNNNNNNIINHAGKGTDFHAVIEGLAGFGEGFESYLASCVTTDPGSDMEEEFLFKEVPVSMDRERWMGLQWGEEDETEGVMGLTGPETEELQEKLFNLRAELRKLNDPGTRLVFKNPEDYFARRRAREEEEKSERASRFQAGQRRSLTERRSVGLVDNGPQLRDRLPRDRLSYTERNEEVSQAVREYRQKRQSLQSADSANSSASSSPRQQRTPEPTTPERPTRTGRTLSSGSGSSTPTSPRTEASSFAADFSSRRPAAGVGADDLPRVESGQAARDVVNSVNPSLVAASVTSVSASSPPLSSSAAGSGGSKHSDSLSHREADAQHKSSAPAQPDAPQRKAKSSPEKPANESRLNASRTSGSQAAKQQTAAPTTGGAVQQQQKSNSAGKQSNTANVDVQQQQQQQQAAQRSTSPESSSTSVSPTRPSKKKSRAPAPPPSQPDKAAATSGTNAKPATASLPPANAPSSGGEAKPPKAETKATLVSLVPASSPPPQPQPQASASSPERPARPKRRKDSKNTSSGSNPISPRDAVPEQPSLSKDKAAANVTPAQQQQAADDSSLLTDVLNALPKGFHQLSEDASIEEEEPPPAHGTFTTTVTVTKEQKSTGTPPTAADASDTDAPVLRLQLDQSDDSSSSLAVVTASAEPVKQKRRKGKAPEPPPLSPSTEGGAPPPPRSTSSSATPSPGNSPRDAPLVHVNSQLSNTQPTPKAPADDSKAAAGVRPPARPKAKAPAPPPAAQPKSPPPVTADSAPKAASAPEAAAAVKRTEEPPVAYPTAKKPDRAAAERTDAPSLEPQLHATITADSSTSVKVEAVLVPRLELASAAEPGVFESSSGSGRLAQDKDRVSERFGRLNSETSSLCDDSDAESLPPPLPNSLPPPLPSSPPPLSQSPLPSPLSAEEVIEVRQVSPGVRSSPSPGAQQRRSASSGSVTSDPGRMEEGVLVEFDSMLPDKLVDTEDDVQKKSVSNLRAQFFGVESSSSATNPDLDLLTMNFGESDVKDHHEDGLSDDSDVSSDERGFDVEGTFSPGDSGVVMSSLPTSPDDMDNKIQLISYTTNNNAPRTSNNNNNDSSTVTIKASTTTTTHSSPPQRPHHLDMSEAPSRKSESNNNNKSPPLVSPEDIASLTPRSREIFEKARHFAEMVQKPTFVAKRDLKTDGAEEPFSQETLQDFELERRAAISQSTMRKKDMRDVMLSPPASFSEESATPAFLLDDVLEQPSPAQQQAEESYQPPPPPPQTSYSQLADERPPSPEARWTDKQPGKVSLYSQNVVQESGQSTDDVDRESIANLATTRRQWEAIFGNNADLHKKEEGGSKAKPKKKWEVRLPYAEKARPSGPATVSANSGKPEAESSNGSMSENGNYAESAIEQEIRLAMEREEMLKREHEEAMRAQEAMKASMSSSMQSSTESELHVHQQQQQPPGFQYDELAEADRGAEFFVNERAVQREDEEQEEAMQRRFSHQKFGLSTSVHEDSGTESIIEREIRLQQEREAELAQMRGAGSPRTAPAPAPTPAPVPAPREPEEIEEVEAEEEIPYEDAISRYNHEGENRIAQELRELREREEEVRQLRERMNKTALNAGSETQPDKKPATPTAAAAASSPVPKQTSKPVSAPPTPRGAVGATTTPRGGGDRIPSVNFSSPRSGSVHATPPARGSGSGSGSQPATPRQETPIEREIRLARERENELRRTKGLPDLPQEPQRQPSFDQPDGRDNDDDNNYNDRFVGTPRYHYHGSSSSSQQPDNPVRRFASNRLQQEIQDQRNREMKLRQEGKIITTSEDHIEPHRYSEVVGDDRTDGAAVKRNFKTPGRRSSGAPAVSEDVNGDGHAGSQMPGRHPQQDSVLKKGSKGSATASFSYREFAQTAESKIERELREMREREEELKKQRTGGAES